jgi:hypothetical protein
MKTRNRMLEKGLSSIDPLADTDLDRFASGSEADELLAAILASNPGEPSGPKRIAHRWFSLSSWRGRLTIAAPVAAAALVLSIIGVPGASHSNPGTLPVLARVAEAAAAQPPPQPAMPYLYQKTQSRSLSTAVWSKKLAWSFFVSETDEDWIAKNGFGRRHKVVAPVKFVGPEDREAWEAAGRPGFQPHAWSGYTEDEKLRPGSSSNRIYERELSEVPTDPTEISEWLMEQVTKTHNGFSPAVRSLALVSEILNDPLATPELRAALYEAEGRVPGIESLGEVTDATGRPGVAIGAESANSGAPTRYSLIFDPKTSQVLATEQTMLKPPAAFRYEKTPVLSEAKLFIESGGTSSLSDKPHENGVANASKQSNAR